ncbi:hypothetical protein, partial [Pseudomonas aeruginosa]
DPWQSVASGNTQLAAGAEVGSWLSVAGRNTQLTAGAEVDPWQSVASGNTQLALGAEARSWRSDSGRNTKKHDARPRLSHGSSPRSDGTLDPCLGRMRSLSRLRTSFPVRVSPFG